MKKIGWYILVAFAVTACANSINTGTVIAKASQNKKVVTKYPIETVLINIHTTERNQELSTLIKGYEFGVKVQVVPKEAMMIGNKQIQTADNKYTFTLNDKVVEESVNTVFFSLKPFRIYELNNISLDSYSLASQTSIVPKTAKVGDSGQWFIEEMTFIENTQSTAINDTNSALWTLSQANYNTAWLCIEDSGTNLYIGYGASTECYKINAKGDILASKWTFKAPIDDVGTLNLISK